MPPTHQAILSKSAYLNGLQCAKLLWHRFNARGQFPPIDDGTQAIFDQGHEVGELAKKLFPDGIEVGSGIFATDQVIKLSKDGIKRRVPLFEAGFVYERAFARIDILNPVSEDSWEIIEVKGTTSVKDEHLHDLAFQAYVLTGAGLKLRRCLLSHINPEFVKNGPIDPKQFFAMKDVTVQVSAMTREIESKVEEIFTTIRLAQSPDVKIGPHCDAPYACPLHDQCWAFLPDSNVTQLYRGGAKVFKLLKDGVLAMKDIPDDFKLTDNQEIQRRAAKTGQPHIDKRAIVAFLSQIKYPISYLDFETINPAIPLFDGTGPFQQIPFQYSLHVQRSANGVLEHHSFLADGTADPRPEFMRRLREMLPDEGLVVAYNSPFELARLDECCSVLPEYRPWKRDVERRLVDLLIPFRGFRYYHPKQDGSASMKAVLPALTSKSYEHLAIQEGGAASRGFLQVMFGRVSEEERARVRKHLAEYCGQDTIGMVWIVNALKETVTPSQA